MSDHDAFECGDHDQATALTVATLKGELGEFKRHIDSRFGGVEDKIQDLGKKVDTLFVKHDESVLCVSVIRDRQTRQEQFCKDIQKAKNNSHSATDRKWSKAQIVAAVFLSVIGIVISVYSIIVLTAVISQSFIGQRQGGKAWTTMRYWSFWWHWS